MGIFAGPAKAGTQYDYFFQNEILLEAHRSKIGEPSLYCSACRAVVLVLVYENDPEFFPEPDVRAYCNNFKHELPVLRATVAAVRLRKESKS